jgi:hypothetical protein
MIRVVVGLYLSAFFLLSSALMIQPALAGISRADCQKIRSLHKQSSAVFYFKSRHGFVPLTDRYSEQFWTEIANQDPDNDGFIFVYLAKSSGVSRSTLFLVKQRFDSDVPSTEVGVYNNIRRHGAQVPFADYQVFSRGGTPRAWVQWLYIEPGWIFNRDLPDSQEMPLPRQMFVFSQAQNGNSLKAYLLAVRGINPDGSCVDFAPTVSREVRSIALSVVNIRRTSAGDAREPVVVKMERDK